MLTGVLITSTRDIIIIIIIVTYTLCHLDGTALALCSVTQLSCIKNTLLTSHTLPMQQKPHALTLPPDAAPGQHSPLAISCINRVAEIAHLFSRHSTGKIAQATQKMVCGAMQRADPLHMAVSYPSSLSRFKNTP